MKRIRVDLVDPATNKTDFCYMYAIPRQGERIGYISSKNKSWSGRRFLVCGVEHNILSPNQVSIKVYITPLD